MMLELILAVALREGVPECEYGSIARFHDFSRRMYLQKHPLNYSDDEEFIHNNFLATVHADKQTLSYIRELSKDYEGYRH